jgi:hypothetical protein
VNSTHFSVCCAQLRRRNFILPPRGGGRHGRTEIIHTPKGVAPLHAALLLAARKPPPHWQVGSFKMRPQRFEWKNVTFVRAARRVTCGETIA